MGQHACFFFFSLDRNFGFFDFAGPLMGINIYLESLL